jgi:hypothetical protein
MTVEIKRRFRVRPVGFRFDALAAWLMCQQYGVDLNGMDKIPREEYVSSWVWSAHKSFCMMHYREPMPYAKMKKFIARMRKTEWDMLLAAMTEVKSPPEEDKKKVQPGQSSLSQDGKQD